MNSNSGAIDFESYIKTDQFKKGMDYMDRRILGFTKTAVTETQKVDDSFRKLGAAAVGAFAGLQLAQLPGQIMRVRGEFQQLEISFTTMLQSKEKADKLMADVTKFASATPYGLKDTAAATKQLLAYGEGADTVIQTMTRLGDIASGIGAPLGDIAYLYGTTMTQGRLYTQDLNQFTGRGIPMIRELAKIFKVAESEVKGLVEAGKVGFPEVQKVIENLTKSGSMFGGLMEAQSKSLVGLQAQLGDAVDAMFNDMGKSQEGFLTATFKGAIGIVESYQNVIDIIAVVTASYGAYRAALMLTTVAQGQNLAFNAIANWWSYAKSVKTATDLQTLFNISVKANPYVIAFTALAALVTGIIVFSKETDAATEASDKLKAAMQATEVEVNKEKASIAVLTTQLKDETKTRGEKEKVLKKLVALNPEILSGITLENAATGRATELVNEYIRAKREQIRVSQIQARLEEELQNELDIKSGKKDGDLRMSIVPRAGLGMAATAAGMSGGVFDASKASEQDFERQKAEALKKSKEVQKALIDQVNGGIEQRRSARRKETEDIKEATAKNIEAYEEEIKALKDKQGKSSSKAEFDRYEKQINALEKAKGKITGGGKKKSDVQKDAKTESDIRIQEFASELDEKRKLYELHQRWIDHYGEDAANQQFKGLLANGKSYMDYLQKEISRLEAMKDVGYSGKLSDSDASDLDNLLNLKREANNEKTALDQFKEQLIDAKGEAKTLAEYLDKLYATRTDLGSPTGANAQDKSVFLNTEIQETERALKTSLNDFLAESANYAQKRIQIEQKFNNYRKGAVLKFTKEELKVELDNIETRRKAELESLADEELEKSDSYQRLHEEIKYFNKAQLKQRIANIEEDLKREEISIKKKIQLEKGLAAAKKALNNNSLENLKIAGNVISQALGDVTLEFTEQFKLNLRDLGSAIEGAASLASFDFQGASTGDKAAAVGNIIQIHSFLITSVRDAFKTASDFFTGMEGQDGYFKQLQNQIEGVNILLERQQYLLGNMTESEKLGGGTMALINAQAKAQEDALQGLKDLSIDVIKSADKVFVDPIFGSEVKAKGFWGVYTQLATAGKAETKIKYSFQQIDTSGFTSIEDYINLLADIKKNGGMIDGKQVVDADLQALELLIKTYQEAEEKQKQLLEDFHKFLTATTEASIADSIVAGLQAGKSSAADFADDFESMMRNAVINSLKAQIMDQKLAAYYKKFGQYAASDGVLDKDEQRELKSDWDGIVSSSKALYDQMEAVTGLDLSKELLAAKTDPLRGAIQGMSQETASVLAGQFNSLRISGADTAASMRQMLLFQANISRNSDFQKHLPLLNDVVAELRASNALMTRGFG